MPARNDPRDLALGAAVLSARAGLLAGRMALVPVGLALRTPVAGPVLQRRMDELSAVGVSARARARDAVLESDELERLICTVIEHERTEVIVQRVMDSPGLERIILRVLDGHLVDEVIERVLHSPELDRIVEYVASSPQVLDAVSHQTRSLADEVAVNVRKRAESVDDAAERTVRGWLRRPRPNPA